MNNDTLCNRFNSIISGLKYIKYNSKILTDKELNNKINELLNDARVCKKYGQKMERRLKEYFDSISKLGWVRKK